ncbi:MAG: 4-phosphopantetheinyl transferase family protein [bacterium]|nr:4-phosphopantetheinyl transferase family protein [bacterium]
MTTATEVSWLSVGLDEVPQGDSWVDEQLARRLARMSYAKRYSETRMARWTAKRAIAMALGMTVDSPTLQSIVVGNAMDGAPEAYVNGEPIDAVIAMTDRADWAVCALIHGNTRVGCDLELVEPRSPAFVADYLTAAEQDIVARSTEPAVTTNTIWSAKESALKVLRTGLRQDTRTVEVSLSGVGTPEWQPLEVRENTGRVFPGWWIRYGDFVLTCTAASPTVVPVSLEVPPALATAIPSHRWMDEMRARSDQPSSRSGSGA